MLCNQSPVSGGHDMGSVGSWGGGVRGTAELEEKSGQQTCESCLTMPCIARNIDLNHSKKGIETRNKFVCKGHLPECWAILRNHLSASILQTSVPITGGDN